jgi:SAM-dependent methyltransferase
MPNERQSEAWNGPESAHYIDQADRYDRQLAPVTDALLARAAMLGRHRVLDVGCGSGAMALAAARVAATVVGVDISEPLTRVARERAHGVDNVEFVVADAQTHPFEAASFDVVISQFGLMFFDEPATAFTNLRSALADDGRLVFSTWRSLADNEWLAPVTRAVAEFADVPDLGGLANGGGMFAMKDDREVAELLETTGFTDVVVEPISPSILLGGGGDAAESADFLLGTGIARGLLSRLDDDQRSRASERIRAQLAEHDEAGIGVRLGAGVWLVHARAASATS